MDTADVLFIAADPREFDGAMRFWSNIQPLALPVHWSRAATWKRKRVVAIANGAGAARAAMAVHAVAYRALCNIGFCGALDPALKVGDIVISDEHMAPRTAYPYRAGLIASIGRVAQTAAEKHALRQTGAVAVEMEASAFENLPSYVIKSVSDLADESFANDFNQALRPDGKIDIPRLLLHASMRPFTRFPELKRLSERSSIASQTLGEFLDSCEF